LANKLDWVKDDPFPEYGADKRGLVTLLAPQLNGKIQPELAEC